MQLIDRKNFFQELEKYNGEVEGFDRKYLAYAIGYTYGALKIIEVKRNPVKKNIKTFLNGIEKFTDLKEELLKTYKRVNRYIKHRGSENTSEMDITLANLLTFIYSYTIENDNLSEEEKATCIAGLEDGKIGIGEVFK